MCLKQAKFTGYRIMTLHFYRVFHELSLRRLQAQSMEDSIPAVTLTWFDDFVDHVTAGYDNTAMRIANETDGGGDINVTIPSMTLASFACNSTIAGPCSAFRSANVTYGSTRPPNVEYGIIRAVTLSFYLAIFFFGLAGNSLIIYVIARLYSNVRGGKSNSSRGGGRPPGGVGGGAAIGSRSVSNLYILNLAAADALFVLTLPFFCYATYTGKWAFGEPVCKLTYAVRETNKYASVLTLVALSVDRCLATFHRVVGCRRTPVAVGVCAAIWTLCLAGAGVPQIVYGRLVDLPNGRRSCRVEWPHLVQLPARRAWIYGQLVLGVVVPFVIIAAVNIVLLLRLKSFARQATTSRQRQARQHQQSTCPSAAGADDGGVCKNSSSSGSRMIRRLLARSAGGSTAAATVVAAPLTRELSASTRRERATRNMIRLVMAIIAIFAVCQLPYHIIEIVSLQMYEIYGGGGGSAPRRPSPDVQRAFVYANAAAQVMVFVSSGCNPIVYGVFNKNYRKLTDAFRCLK
jgi:hypothetical protein